MLALAWAGVSTASRQVVENRQVPFDLPGVSGVFGCHWKRRGRKAAGLCGEL